MQQGKPSGDEVTLDQPDGAWTFNQLAMTGFSDTLFGLAYRRADDSGHQESCSTWSTPTACATETRWVLTTQAGPNGGVDLSSDGEGAGVIYSLADGESEQLWFQRLGLDGRAAHVMSGIMVGGASDPVRIVGPPYKAVDASLAKLPTGYAVAYRALPGGNVDSPRIRIHFLDRFGRIIGQSDATLATMYGGRTAIKAAYDGRVTVGYSDSDENTGDTTIVAIKLPCLGGP